MTNGTLFSVSICMGATGKDVEVVFSTLTSACDGRLNSDENMALINIHKALGRTQETKEFILFYAMVTFREICPGEAWRWLAQRFWARSSDWIFFYR